MEVDRNGLEVLGRNECVALLRDSTLGRLALTSGALPLVLPVNFLLDGDRILVRTGGGRKLDAATDGTVVAFEVDDFDPLYHSGWSVLVTGVAREVTDPDDLRRLASAPLPHWAPNGGDRIIAISMEMVSGRRLVAGASLRGKAAARQ